MNCTSVSGWRPAIIGLSTKREVQPRACRSSAVSQSSVIDTPEKPPASSSAVRLSTAAEPQKKAAFQRSRPRWITE